MTVMVSVPMLSVPFRTADPPNQRNAAMPAVPRNVVMAPTMLLARVRFLVTANCFQMSVWKQFAVTKKRTRANSIVGAITTFLGTAGIAAFLWFGGSAVLNGTLSIGTLTMTVI